MGEELTGGLLVSCKNKCARSRYIAKTGKPGVMPVCEWPDLGYIKSRFFSVQ